jgi:hypothetical protein
VFGLGQFATGYAAIGQMALAYYGLAQIALAVHAWTPQHCDPEARRFFRLLWEWLTRQGK